MDKKILSILAIVVMTSTFFVSDVQAKCDPKKRMTTCCKKCLNKWESCRKEAGDSENDKKQCNVEAQTCEEKCD